MSGAIPPKPDGVIWTDAQWRAIATIDRSVLVSAAAGSGKTAVLAARCAYLVCDAPQRCNVDELLVVTFTEAAAAEMKERIQRFIRARIATTNDTELTRQLALIDRMQVSTLHSFCAKLLRQHFNLLGLDPSFTVLDADEAALMRVEVARELFEKRYEDDADGAFQAFIDACADGYDEGLINRVISAHEMLNSLLDPQGWIDRARKNIDEACDVALEESTLGRELIELLCRRLDDLVARCHGAIDVLSSNSGLVNYVTALQDLKITLNEWCELLRKRGLDALVRVFAKYEHPRLKPVKSDVAGKEQAKRLVDSVRTEIKNKDLASLLRFTSAQWIESLRSCRAHSDVFLQLVADFGKHYEREKRAARAVDFTDLERLALQALRDPSTGVLAPSHVARQLHRQFRHVLVDEYQDINELQDAILTLLSTECLAPDAGANLFCVGDVKQSIYRFRLAEPHRFLQRHHRFSSGDCAVGALVHLQDNFRSRGPLLEALNQVFGLLMSKTAAEIEYDEAHRLNPGLEYPAGDGKTCFVGAPIELHLLPDELEEQETDDEESPAVEYEDEIAEMERAEREALCVARRILRLVGVDGSPTMHVMDRQPDSTLSPRPIRYSDIVILLRAMKFKAEQFADVLRRCGIPVHSEGSTGYFESIEVRDVLALLAVLDNRRQDIPLAAVLRSPIGALPDPQDSLARIRLAYRKTPFHEAVVRYAKEHEDALALRLRELLAQLDKWREMTQRQPLAHVLWDIYDETGYLAFCAGLRDGAQRVANLIELHERARQFGSFHRQGLSRFLAFLETLRREQDLGQPSVASGAENVVRIMSVHSAKGLEFPVVFLPDLGKQFNLSSTKGNILLERGAGLGMAAVDEEKQIRYPSLATALVQDRLVRQSLAEELRVLYVAGTRAREHLILVGTRKSKSIANWLSRRAGADGRLAADAVLSARTMLDWVGTTAAVLGAFDKEGNPEPNDVFDVTLYSAEAVLSWSAPESLRQPEPRRLKQLASLKKLPRAPESNPQAEQIIERLTRQYTYQHLTEVPAVQAASAIATPTDWEEPAPAIEPDEIETPQLVMPRSLGGAVGLSAADVGAATHLVLQRLDLSRRCDLDDLAAQVQELEDRRLIAPAAAEAVDLDAVAWFISTPLGKRLRDSAQHVYRELPIYFPRWDGDANPPSPLDRTMIRSRLDVLMALPDGPEIIDYKTDHVTDETLPLRIAHYQSQMSMYRQAVEAIVGKSPRAVHLVFLAPRIIHTM